MVLNLPIHYMLILVLDVFIVVILLVVFYRIGRDKSQIKTIDTMQLNNLKRAFEKIMSDSKETSTELMNSFDQRIRALNEVHEKIYTKEKRLEENIVHAEELIKKIDVKIAQEIQKDSDPYKVAVELISQGRSSEAVQRICGLSLSEVDLIKQLASHKSHNAGG